MSMFGGIPFDLAKKGFQLSPWCLFGVYFWVVLGGTVQTLEN